MTNYPIVRFVASVGDTAPVLDLNEPSEGLMVLHDGFSLGSPTYEAAPLSVGVRLGERTLSGTMRVRTDQANAARLLQAFAAEVLKPTNVLMFQIDASSEPMWARTYQTEQEPISLENTSVERSERRYDLPYSLVADAYFYGAPHSLGTYSITNNPSSTAYSITPTNLAPNPNAGVSTAGWSTTAGALTRTTLAQSRTGTHVFTWAAPLTASAAYRSTRTPVVAGSTYSVGLDEFFVGGGGSRLTNIRVRWFNGAGSQVSSTVNGAGLGAMTGAASQSMRRRTLAGLLAPAGATSMEVGLAITLGTGASTVHFNAVMVNAGAAALPYRDGSSAGWGWAGTPHASVSGPMVTSSGASYPSQVALPSIPGDAPAELSMRVLPSASWHHHDVVAHVAAFSDPSDSTAIVLPIDASWTGTGAGGTVATAAMVTGQYRAVTGATATLSHPEIVVRPGAYHAYLRMAKSSSTTTSTWTASLSSGGARIGDASLGVYDAGVATGNRSAYVDLGVVTLPRATDARRLTGGAATFPLTLTMTRHTGATTAWLDCLVLIPVDAARIVGSCRSSLEFRALSGPAVGTSDIAAVLDAQESATWQESPAGIASGAPAIASGGFPQVWPNATNVLHLLQQTRSRGPAATTADSDTTTAAAQVELWCLPRYLYMATGA